MHAAPILAIAVFLTAWRPACDQVREDLRSLEIMLDAFRSLNGTFPEALRQLSPGTTIGVRYMFVDPYGRDYHYEPMFPTGYRLCSAGPDGVRDTRDDICVGSASEPCQLSSQELRMMSAYYPERGARCLRAIEDVGLWRARIDSYYANRQNHPNTLTDLIDDTGQQSPLSLIDPWGYPYQYSSEQNSYLVFSAGPDRIPNTWDDIGSGFDSSRCAQPQQSSKTAPFDAVQSDPMILDARSAGGSNDSNSDQSAEGVVGPNRKSSWSCDRPHIIL